jgi:hypothetical protein
LVYRAQVGFTEVGRGRAQRSFASQPSGRCGDRCFPRFVDAESEVSLETADHCVEPKALVEQDGCEVDARYVFRHASGFDIRETPIK